MIGVISHVAGEGSMHPNPWVSAETAAGARTRESPEPHEEITRHLAAAAHLKPGFANRVISTYVTAPQEALPPAPGMDALVILTQALIARHRRGIRDALTIFVISATASMLVVTEIGVACFWLGFWLLWTGVARVRRWRFGDKADGDTLGLLPTVLLWLAWLLVATSLPLPLDLSPATYSVDYIGMQPLPSTAWPVLLVLVGIAVVYLILLSDKIVQQHFLARNGSDYPPANPPRIVEGLANTLESMSTKNHRALLTELAHRPTSGHVLVHRDREAFVGHGDQVNAWTMALALKEKHPDGSPPAPLRPSDIYRAVGADLTNLRQADLLAPKQRLRDLSISNMLVASGRGLRKHRDDAVGRDILPDTSGRPAPAVPPETMQHVMDHNQEWARHFQRCSVASWDSDLVVSTFFHVACDNRILYLEWNASCLFPISREYRKAGHFDTRIGHAARLAWRELKRLPRSMGTRWRSARRTMSATAATGPHQGPFGYGSVQSIREIAAGDGCDSQFLDLDGQRYMQVLERRTLTAVHRYLSDCGYATEELESRIDTVINNSTVIQGGQFMGAQNFGANGSASADNVTTEKPDDSTPEETS